ncbi:disulfide bond formation protein B [Bartonella tamiae]|uniref:Disulfide bond formation protein B n=1 Tax=Bartonella tamiae Th239 TaxID=1094558 RepID=J1K2J5_9HYPH|nr:disulfide bond formation protein B [Bartonella tamiae]EJF91707.1 hypothetical protein ME5_00086 [Bartonella tamiae Th239]EJF92626.1 hypothetical protein MEG_01796 [Bartonella tamiae Th307]
MVDLTILTKPIHAFQTWMAFVLAFFMAFIVGFALWLEHSKGYMPCKLCLEERDPYYIGIALALFIGFLAHKRVSGFTVRCMFLFLSVLMFYSFGLALYHTGIEFKIWKGPSDCSSSVTAITQNASDLLSSLNSKRPPACDKAAGYIMGLSFATWNGICSLIVSFIAVITAFKRTSKDVRD